MPDLQAIATFPGISRILGATMTRSHGISPAPIVITAAFQPQIAQPVGAFAIRYGNVRLEFPDCAVDFSTVRGGPGGNQITFQLLDRRWKWRPISGGGQITLKANVRRKDGTIDEDTEITPQQLAAALLNAMGERRFSVAALPNDTRPEVDWVAENPATVLASLCDSLGCRIVLDLNNRVRIVRAGVGALLPIPGVITPSLGFNPPERPDALLFVGGPTLFQSKLLLEAVGEDRNGRILPIDSLSYKPSDGWERTTPGVFDAVADDKDRKLAQKTVFRWYRIVSQADGSNVVPGYGPVPEIKHLLPLRDVQVLTSKDKDGVEVPRSAAVEGVFYNNVGETPTLTNTAAGTQYGGGFSIDTERGIVMFNQPAYRSESMEVIAATFLFAKPAELYLNTSYSVTNTATNQKVRETFGLRLPGQARGTGVRVIKREQLQFTHAAFYFSDLSLGLTVGTLLGNISLASIDVPTRVFAVGNNRRTWEPEVRRHLANAALEYQNVQTAEGEYTGILGLDLDGAIQQITYTLGNAQPASTRVSRNSEHSLTVPSRIKRRQNAVLQNLANEAGPDRVSRLVRGGPRDDR